MRNDRGDDKAIVDNDSLYISNNPLMVNSYFVHLTTEIGDSKHYRELYNCLRQASPDDFFHLHLANFGGYLHTGIEIINAIRACPGHVFTYMVGGCYSMAPLIVLSGDRIFVEDDSFLMFHDYSGGSGGKGSEMEKQIKFEKPYFDHTFGKIVNKFLTKKEIKHIIEGQDLYLTDEEVKTRLRKLGKLGNDLNVG